MFSLTHLCSALELADLVGNTAAAKDSDTGKTQLPAKALHLLHAQAHLGCGVCERATGLGQGYLGRRAGRHVCLFVLQNKEAKRADAFVQEHAHAHT